MPSVPTQDFLASFSREHLGGGGGGRREHGILTVSKEYLNSTISTY